MKLYDIGIICILYGISGSVQKNGLIGSQNTLQSYSSSFGYNSGSEHSLLMPPIQTKPSYSSKPFELFPKRKTTERWSACFLLTETCYLLPQLLILLAIFSVMIFCVALSFMTPYEPNISDQQLIEEFPEIIEILTAFINFILDSIRIFIYLLCLIILFLLIPLL